jgi:hypothetical protein
LRLPMSLSLLAIGAALAVAIAGAARAAHTLRPADPRTTVRGMRSAVDHYRGLTWTYQRVARQHLTPTSYSYRRSKDRSYLKWTLDVWQRHEYQARDHAIALIRRRLVVHLPHPPGLHAPLAKRIAYDRRVALRLRRIYLGGSTRSFASARASNARRTLVLWQARAASAALAVSRHAARWTLQAPASLVSSFVCIHQYEGAWDANTGNGYFGGLQLDWGFMRRYGPDYLARWGTADNWPVWAQLQAAVRAHDAGRGFYPWPHTARLCGLM